MSIKDLEAEESVGRLRAERLLRDRVTASLERQTEVIRAAKKVVIVDKLVNPKVTRFMLAWNKLRILHGEEDDQPKSIHSHALTQMASVMGIPKLYVNRLSEGETWERDLLIHNLNELFHQGTYLDRAGNPTKFLHRLVGTEVRGFLSRNYNRKLMTAPLLGAFVSVCEEHGAAPVEGYTTDIRTTLKWMLPMVFEPVDNEFVAFGVTFTNSDFGAGRLKISGTVMRVKSGTISLLQDNYSRTHLGSIIQESDIEMSDETADKEVQTAISAVQDTVRGVLGKRALESHIRAIKAAHEAKVPWHKLKEALSTLVGKKDIEFLRGIIDNGPEVVDLPPAIRGEDNEPILTGWSAANLVGWWANKEDDVDKKTELQALAGKIISK